MRHCRVEVLDNSPVGSAEDDSIGASGGALWPLVGGVEQ